MLIISKFHDYYDTATAYGIDKECVYARTPIDLEDEELFPHWRDYMDSFLYIAPNNIKHCYKEKEYIFYSGIIGFCGKLYPYIKVKISYIGAHFQPITDIKCFYNNKELSQLLSSIGYSSKKNRYRRYKDWAELNGLESFFKTPQWNKVDHLYRKYNCPIFKIHDITATKRKITLNPTLKDYEFYKVKDAFTAFQEIHMYLSGVLGVNDKIITDIPDEYKLYEKGFDDRSFKRDKGTPERKRKKK